MGTGEHEKELVNAMQQATANGATVDILLDGFRGLRFVFYCVFHHSFTKFYVDIRFYFICVLVIYIYLFIHIHICAKD